MNLTREVRLILEAHALGRKPRRKLKRQLSETVHKWQQTQNETLRLHAESDRLQARVQELEALRVADVAEIERLHVEIARLHAVNESLTAEVGRLRAANLQMSAAHARVIERVQTAQTERLPADSDLGRLVLAMPPDSSLTHEAEAENEWHYNDPNSRNFYSATPDAVLSAAGVGGYGVAEDQEKGQAGA